MENGEWRRPLLRFGPQCYDYLSQTLRVDLVPARAYESLCGVLEDTRQSFEVLSRQKQEIA